MTPLTPRLFRGGRFGRLSALPEALLDVDGDHLLELIGDVGAAERCDLPAIYEDGRRRLLAGAGERDADVGVFALAGTVDDAAHYSDRERLDPGIALSPLGHRGTEMILDVLGQRLEHRRGGAPTAGAGGNHRQELAEAHGLQQFLCRPDL